MWAQLTAADRRVLLIAAIFFALFAYLLFNDKLITNWSIKHSAVVAQVYKTENDVRQKFLNDFRWNQTKSGIVYRGDSIFTGPNSAADIVLPDQSIIHLDENSLITFNQVGDQISLGLKFGHISGNLKTAISIDGFSSRSGNFDVTSAGGGKVAKRKPSSLLTLTPPDLITSKIEHTIDNVNPLLLKWTPSPGATEYTLEISKNTHFRKPQKYQATQPELVLKNISAGQFYYRVIATNPAQHMKSRPSVAGEIIAKQIPPIPLPIDPKHYFAKDLKDLGAPTDFILNWNNNFQNPKYQVQISESQNFKNPQVVTTKTSNSVIKIKNTGTYYWRVRSLSLADQPLSDFSKPGEIIYTLHKPLRAPALAEPIDNTTLFFQSKRNTPFWLEWEPVSYAKSYALQVATDPKFKNIIISKELSDSKYLNHLDLSKGDLYWRVKALAPSHYSVWSEPQKMSVYSGRSARIYQ